MAAVILAALVALPTTAMAQVPSAPSNREPLSDAELDQVTAGQTTQFLLIRNPGNVNKGEGLFQTHGNNIKCINCFGIGSEDTFGFKTITNPAKAKPPHCISTTTCL